MIVKVHTVDPGDATAFLGRRVNNTETFAYPTVKRLTCLACLVATLLVNGCSDPATEAEPIRPVRAIKVGDLKGIESREFPGRATAKDEVDLSFQVAGPLVSLSVDVGTAVKKGDVIAAIDPRDFQAALDSNQGSLERARANLLAMERGARPEEIEQLKATVEQAEASYKQAAAELERNTEFVKTGAVSKSEFEVSQARAQRTLAEIKSAKEGLNIGLKGARIEDLEAKRAEIKALEAAVATAKNQLDYSVLTAPFDGEVAARFADNFQTVQAKVNPAREGSPRGPTIWGRDPPGCPARMVLPEVGPRMIVCNLVADFVAALPTVVLSLLPVLNSARPVFGNGTFSETRPISDSGTVANARSISNSGSVANSGSVTGSITSSGTVSDAATWPTRPLPPPLAIVRDDYLGIPRPRPPQHHRRRRPRDFRLVKGAYWAGHRLPQVRYRGSY